MWQIGKGIPTSTTPMLQMPDHPAPMLVWRDCPMSKSTQIIRNRRENFHSRVIKTNSDKDSLIWRRSISLPKLEWKSWRWNLNCLRWKLDCWRLKLDYWRCSNWEGQYSLEGRCCSCQQLLHYQEAGPSGHSKDCHWDAISSKLQFDWEWTYDLCFQQPFQSKLNWQTWKEQYCLCSL